MAGPDDKESVPDTGLNCEKSGTMATENSNGKVSPNVLIANEETHIDF
jgi:hypothetical protein